MTTLDRILSTLEARCGLVRGRPLVVGVSGGPDSLCLMDALRRAGLPLRIAHFNHRLRPEAEQEAAAVRRMAEGSGFEYFEDGADVRAQARQQGLSVEAAARLLRYGFLFDLARRTGAQAVAVGHTADDQVETVLLHVLRGSGLAGLQGMAPRSVLRAFDPAIPLVRPLLGISREETIEYCREANLDPSFDASNASLEYGRNRIRHELIPILETYNPKVRDAVLRMADSLRGDQDIVAEAVAAVWKEAVLEEGEGIVEFDAARLAQALPGLVRGVIRRALLQLQPDLDPDFAAVERARSLIAVPGPRSHADLLRGMRAFREGERSFLLGAGRDAPLPGEPPAIDEPLPVPVPGRVDLAGGWRLTADVLPPSAEVRRLAGENRDEFQAWIDPDSAGAPLVLRARKNGDRFGPLGLDGHLQKLSDFFVNVKLPQRARDRWPLLCSGEVILWVPGCRPAHVSRLTDSTRAVWHFSLAVEGRGVRT